MKILQVALTALGSVLVLFLLTKLMGKRQIAQLSFFDYIIGISIGSIAAELATELEDPLYPLIAMTVYALAAVVISLVTDRSLFWRKIFTGRSVLLMENGKLYRDNMKRCHIDLHEMLSAARVAGYFDLRQVDTIVLEYNGRMSFLPREADRPMQVSDAGLSPEQQTAPVNLIVDGRLLSENLKLSGNDETWLKTQLGTLSVDEVFYAAVDHQNRFFYYPKKVRKACNDRW